MSGLSNSFLSFCQKGELIFGTGSCDVYLPKVIIPYHAFPMAGVKWFAFYREYHEFDTPPKNNETSCIYTFNGEIITQNGNDYHTLVEESGTNTFTYYIDHHDSTYHYNDKKAIGGFREKDKKVYFWDIAQNKERLVYDLTLAKGDTFAYEGRKFALLDTGYTVLDGKYYKNFVFRTDKPNSSDTYTVIEGIGGNQFAPHLPYAEHTLRDSNYNPVKDQFFEAFCSGDKLLLQQYFITDCNTELPKPENTPTLLPEETISPNPVSDKCFLNLKNMNGREPKIEIYDIMGRIMQTIEVSAKAVEIDVQDLPSGIYFVRFISTFEQRFVGKMWVKH